MATNDDWKAAAREDMLARLAEAQARAQHWSEIEDEAADNRVKAEEDENDLYKAAEVLGIHLGNQVRVSASAASAALTAREIILETLKAAYPKPMKAAELRKVIEERLGRTVHYKTPGMTLYRLADDRLVRREGHSWFAVEGGQLALGQQQQEAPID